LVPEGSEYLTQWLVVGTDTVALGALPFEASTRSLRVGEAGGDAPLEFTYRDEQGFAVRLRYTFQPDGYLVAAEGAVEGLGGAEAALLTRLGSGLEIHEHPDHNSERELAVVSRGSRGVDREAIRRIQGVGRVDPGLTWIGVK